ncbi:hypothetical protein ElyMa_005123100 [Elysia marginata]|uniref:ZP domain-containing protein n=1 Tax=Elysia marginata TaxID=1093978 RepID=A0AAV4JNN5_9GAST|nr:hypothetical protein ElyMa_005123100 [Elysia marginata]
MLLSQQNLNTDAHINLNTVHRVIFTCSFNIGDEDDNKGDNNDFDNVVDDTDVRDDNNKFVDYNNGDDGGDNNQYEYEEEDVYKEEEDN